MPRQQGISIMKSLKYQNKESNNLNSKVMKKVKFYAAALASLLVLGACSSSDDLNGGASGERVRMASLILPSTSRVLELLVLVVVLIMSKEVMKMEQLTRVQSLRYVFTSLIMMVLLMY